MHYNTEYGKACTATGSTGTAYGTETKNQRKKQRARRSHRVTSRAHYTRLIYLYSTAAVLSRGRFIRSHAYTHMGMVMLMGIDGRACRCTIADITPGPTMLAYWNGTGQRGHACEGGWGSSGVNPRRSSKEWYASQENYAQGCSLRWQQVAAWRCGCARRVSPVDQTRHATEEHSPRGARQCQAVVPESHRPP